MFSSPSKAVTISKKTDLPLATGKTDRRELKSALPGIASASGNARQAAASPRMSELDVM